MGSEQRPPLMHIVRRIRRKPQPVRILVTGGWGTTARRLAALLHAEGNVSLILTSRSGRVPARFKHECVTFDWFKQETYEGVFGNAYGGVDRVYLVAPPTVEVMKAMKPFIDFCLKQAVARFVFLSGSLFDMTTGVYGEVHKYIASLGVDYCVLRPTSFMENLSAAEHLPSIRQENTIYSSAENGRLAWVSADDIAAVAVSALMGVKSYNTDVLILGPELLTYDQVRGPLDL
ncbi:hypothetical protein HWV62_10743 [Athelia sp. TMB]|nr:hypothetical protein HWV62_10743 [Athelia sp. TMB]